jgi:WD40 repeat protein
MPDVFLSYSRRDIEFVRRLHGALTARQKDVWVDWEDIPPTAEWLVEVFAGIESSDNFVFVITPESLASEVCARELEHAVSQHKRLVPILHLKGDRPVPESLSARNWTYIRPEDDFDAAFEQLVTALETDLEWVGAHTRLLSRALEWEQRDRDGSLLLRGRDLGEAERWAAGQAPERDPQPTPLQLEYLLASRSATTRRQRVVVGAALTAVVVSSALALAAWQQRNTAVEERGRAERAARLALSRQLAAQAEARLDTSAEQSLALAARAARVAGTEEARSALRRALRAAPARHVLPVSGLPVLDAELSPDGRRVLTASEDGARILDARTGKPLASFPAGAGLSSARFSRDGLRVVTADTDTAKVWRAVPGVGSPEASFGDAPLAAAFAPGGAVVATVGGGSAELWRRSGKLVRRLPTPGAPTFRSVTFNPAGDRLVAGGSRGAYLWETATGDLLARLGTGKVADAVFSPDGSRIATAEPDGVARIWLASTGKLLAELDGSDAELQGIAFSSDGLLLLAAGDDQTARLWEVDAAVPIAELFVGGGSVQAVSFGDGDRLLATADQSGEVTVWRSPASPALELRAPNDEPVLAVAFSPDGKLLATAGQDGAARLWDARTGSPGAVLPHADPPEGDWVESVAFDPSGRLVVTAADDGVAKVWLVPNGSLRATLFATGETQLLAAAFSPDGSLVVAGGARGIHSWAWRASRRSTRVPAYEKRVTAISFDPAGDDFATASTDHSVRLWETATRRQVEKLPGAGSWVTSVTFSPDGRRLAYGTFGGDIGLWDVAGRTRVDTPAGRSAVTAIAFSRDGRFTAAATEDGLVRVVASDSGRRIAQLRARIGELRGIAFGPGSQIAAAGEGGRTVVLDCVECLSLRELLCLAGERLAAAQGGASAPAGCTRRG